MFTALSLDEIEGTDWVPQAIFKYPVERFYGLGMVQHAACDGLGDYRGSFGRTIAISLAFKQYRGFPDGHTSLYLPSSVTDHRAITRRVYVAQIAFGLQGEDIFWQRADGVSYEKGCAALSEPSRSP